MDPERTDMTTARKHFSSRFSAASFYDLKKQQGFNVGAIRLPFPQDGKLVRQWIVFWSPGFMNPGRSKRA